MKKIIFMTLIAFVVAVPASAETVTLKSGRTIEGEIIEKTDDYVTVDTGKQSMKIRFRLMDQRSALAFKDYDHKQASVKESAQAAKDFDVPSGSSVVLSTKDKSIELNYSAAFYSLNAPAMPGLLVDILFFKNEILADDLVKLSQMGVRSSRKIKEAIGQSPIFAVHLWFKKCSISCSLNDFINYGIEIYQTEDFSLPINGKSFSRSFASLDDPARYGVVAVQLDIDNDNFVQGHIRHEMVADEDFMQKKYGVSEFFLKWDVNIASPLVMEGTK